MDTSIQLSVTWWSILASPGNFVSSAPYSRVVFIQSIDKVDTSTDNNVSPSLKLGLGCVEGMHVCGDFG
jgi:hypothetical protein